MKKKFPSKPDTANESLFGFRGIKGCEGRGTRLYDDGSVYTEELQNIVPSGHGV